MATPAVSAALAALVALALPSSGEAYTSPRGAPTLAAVELASGPPARLGRLLRDRPATPQGLAALARIEAVLGPTLTTWDPATGVPAYVIPRGPTIPGAAGDPARARAFAESLLSDHLDLLAPGCAPSDFTLVSDHLGRGLRTLGFVQRHRGHPVVGGQLSLRLRGDRLVAIASQALPCADLPEDTVTVDAETAAAAEAAAVAWVRARDGAATATAVQVDAPVILPRLGDTRVLQADLVLPIEVTTTGPHGRWRVYVDAVHGAPIARESLLHFAVGARYNVPRRGPLGPRYDAPASRITFEVDGVPVTADTGGFFPLDAPAAVTATIAGPIVQVFNASGPNASSQWVVSPGETLVWDQRSDEFVDAQLSAAIHTVLVKDHVRTIDPTNPFLDQQILATVNIDDFCNAFSDGDSINFFAAGAGCANTARLSDVVYHEFGHSIHWQSLIPGVGSFDGSLSEGISDFLSATITGDSGLGRGFFNDDEALRELDPPDYEWSWPEDLGFGVHHEGQIIGGTLWDLRKILRGKLGAAGIAHTDRLWYESIRRAVDIPSMYLESLIADDDDGDLSNGTPNGCEIAAAYGAHGLRSATTATATVSHEPATAAGYPIRVETSGLLADCPGGTPGGAILRWRRRDNPSISGSTPMLADASGGFVGTIPPLPAGVIQYQIDLVSASGTELLPGNLADPWYERYIGEVVELYCTDFESDPFAAGWSLAGFVNDFEWGEVAGDGRLTPGSAASGLRAVGNTLGGGAYPAFSDGLLISPAIGTQGFEELRLQYRRWLSVEDGFYDQAEISSGGATLWGNYASGDPFDANTHHIDGEWRFHDVDLSGRAIDGLITVAFALRSDGGLEFGGWAIDDFCVVGVAGPPAPGICGDGILDPGEACDDGNNVDGDGCSATCELEGGTTTTTDGETTADETAGDTESDTDSDTDTDTGGSATAGADGDLIDRGCACNAPGGGAGGGAGLLLILPLLWRRRRS